MSEHAHPAEIEARRRKPVRRYRVEDTLTVVGVGEVEAKSKAEAVEKARCGEVEFWYNDGQDVRRGDGIRAYVIPPKRPDLSVRPLSVTADE